MATSGTSLILLEEKAAVTRAVSLRAELSASGPPALSCLAYEIQETRIEEA